MKLIKLLAVVSLLAFLLAASANAQSCTQLAQGTVPPYQLGLVCNFTASSAPFGAFQTNGILYWQVTFVPSGTVSSASLSLDSSTTGLSGSWTTGGILSAATIGSMTSAGHYGPNSSATTAANYGQLTPTVVGTGTVTVTLLGYTNSPGGGTAAANTLTSANTYNVTSYGFTCDGSTDNTSALNTLLSTIVSAGGGTLVFPVTNYANRCVFNSAEITLPNNADTWTDGAGTISSQPPMRWTCAANGPLQTQQLMSAGATISQIQSACLVDFKFNATDAKLVGLGMGMWEIDHLTFVDTASDCSPFFLLTNTQPYFHDNSFIGSTISNGTTHSCNDGIVLGSASGTQPSKTLPAWFQGYAQSGITHNFFNQIKRAVLWQAAANTIPATFNTVWSQSGCTACGAFEIAGAGYGNLIAFNNVEATHYPEMVNVTGSATSTLVEFNNCSDSSEFATKSFVTVGLDSGTLYIGGYNGTCTHLAAGNLTTNALIPNTDGVWNNSMHWNGFYNLLEQTGSPGGTAGAEAYWADVFYQRPVFTKWHTSTKLRMAAVEEIPSTQVSIASDNFTRANAGTLGANWTAINSLSSLQIVSNNAEAQTTSAYNGNFYSASTFPADQWSQCTVGSATSNSNAFALCAVRVQSVAESFYSLFMRTDGGSCSIRKFTAGTPSDLATCSPVSIHGSGVALQAGDTLTITVIGSTITGYQNGVQIVQTTDASFTSGSPGIAAFPNATLTNITFSNWAGGSTDCVNGVITQSIPGIAAPICTMNSTQFTTAAMTQQTSATLTAITNMSWPLAANTNYNLTCDIPVTFAASATIAFGLVGPGTPTSYNLDAYGLIGASAVFADINIVGQTTWVSTKTGASGAPGASTQIVHVNSQIQNGTTAGALTLDTAANGTNGITVGANAACRMTQQN